MHDLVTKGSWFAITKEYNVLLVMCKLPCFGVGSHLAETSNTLYSIVEKREDGEAICILGELFQENPS